MIDLFPAMAHVAAAVSTGVFMKTNNTIKIGDYIQVAGNWHRVCDATTKVYFMNHGDRYSVCPDCIDHVVDPHACPDTHRVLEPAEQIPSHPGLLYWDSVLGWTPVAGEPCQAFRTQCTSPVLYAVPRRRLIGRLCPTINRLSLAATAEGLIEMEYEKDGVISVWQRL